MATGTIWNPSSGVELLAILSSLREADKRVLWRCVGLCCILGTRSLLNLFSLHTRLTACSNALHSFGSGLRWGRVGTRRPCSRRWASFDTSTTSHAPLHLMARVTVAFVLEHVCSDLGLQPCTPNVLKPSFYLCFRLFDTMPSLWALLI